MASISPQRHLPTRLATGAATAAVLLGAICAAVLALASPAAASTHAVMIQHYAYSPAALSVDQGDTVTWTNMDSVQHDVTVTSGPTSFHSPMLAQGQSWSFRFTTAGAYSYICSVHPDMRASVTVTAKAQTAPKPAPATKSAPQVAPTTATTAAALPATPKRHRAPATAPAATQVAAPAATQEVATTPAAVSTESLNPLLLVAGASTAVMVFCLLLMTSRPVALPGATRDDPVLEPVEEPEDA